MVFIKYNLQWYLKQIEKKHTIACRMHAEGKFKQEQEERLKADKIGIIADYLNENIGSISQSHLREIEKKAEKIIR